MKPKTKLTRGDKERLVYSWAKTQPTQVVAQLLVRDTTTVNLDSIIFENNLNR
jgi:hypothetical protein